MVTFVNGNILESPAQVICNPVNCVGVSGKGLALQFKKKFPDFQRDYERRCRNKDVQPGVPYLWENETTQILVFPTKDHWRGKSELFWIESGLVRIRNNYQRWGITSLALPALGCGEGGLNWNDVSHLIRTYLSDLPDLEVFVYEPENPA